MEQSGDGSKYWDSLYSKGGASGEGSIGIHRKKKWEIIDSFIGPVNEVIDVGCGDLSFWEGRDCVNYTGIDISPTIIETNKWKRPSWNFIVADASIPQPISANVVFCFDFLYHVMDDSKYDKILSNLMKYSKDWIFIYTWKKNPLLSWKFRTRIFFYRISEAKIQQAIKMLQGSSTDFHYQTFRDLSASIPTFESEGFTLHAEIEEIADKWNAMYVFKRK